MSTTTAVSKKVETCAHWGCGCRVTDETYCCAACESVTSGQAGSASAPATTQAVKRRTDGTVKRSVPRQACMTEETSDTLE